MTDEERDAIIGRTMREHRDAGEHLAAVETELDRIASGLTAVAHLLRTTPDTITDTMLARLDGDRLRALLAERQQLRVDVRRLADRLKDLGVR